MKEFEVKRSKIVSYEIPTEDQKSIFIFLMEDKIFVLGDGDVLDNEYVDKITKNYLDENIHKYEIMNLFVSYDLQSASLVKKGGH